MKKIALLTFLTLSLILSSCLELDITNPNAPDNETVLSDEGNLTSIAGSIFYGVLRGYWTDANYFSVNSSLEFTADHTTMTNNVLNWWSIWKIEPRAAVENTISWTNKAQVTEAWNGWNGTIVNANTVIKTLEAKADLTDNLKGLLASVYFCRAMALSYIGTAFDKGFIVPIDDPAYVATLVPYADVLTEAYSNFETAIDLFESVPDFVLPDEILNGLGYTSEEMVQLCNTYYAHFLVSSARNATQNAATDWAKVKSLSENGITSDYVINADGTNFVHGFQSNSGLYWYFRIDHRIMRHFNPNLPKRFPNNTDAPTSPYDEAWLKGTGYTGDARLDAYFKFESDLSFFRASRNDGILRSHYRIKRYDDLFAANGTGPSVLMYAYANKLYLTEAEARLGNLTAALAILNDDSNPRNAVGLMADLPGTLTQQEILDVIFQERDIELGRTEWGLPFFDMRRKDALQTGTILHLPVPADELTTQGVPIYTFGGGAGDGINTANGSNSWRN